MRESHLSSTLWQIVDNPPFDGAQGKFAAKVQISLSVVNRVILGRRRASPEIVERICRALRREDAAAVLTAYLSDVADEVLTETGSYAATVAVAFKSRRR